VYRTGPAYAHHRPQPHTLLGIGALSASYSPCCCGVWRRVPRGVLACPAVACSAPTLCGAGMPLALQGHGPAGAAFHAASCMHAVTAAHIVEAITPCVVAWLCMCVSALCACVYLPAVVLLGLPLHRQCAAPRQPASFCVCQPCVWSACVSVCKRVHERVSVESVSWHSSTMQ
jgi:hypothetical protein